MFERRARALARLNVSPTPVELSDRVRQTPAPQSNQVRRLRTLLSYIFGTLAYFSYPGSSHTLLLKVERPLLIEDHQPLNLEEIMSKLHSAVKVGPYEFSHRVVLAPLTRMRAEEGAKPGPLMAEYYAQRASEGGFLIGEATIAAPDGNGYLGAPGLYDDSQIAGWKQVTDAVHAKGGRIFLQLYHAGRQSQQPVAAGRRPAGGAVRRAAWRRRLHRSGLDPEHAEPRADDRRDRRSGRELSHGRPARQGGRLRRRRTACRQWLPVRSVPAGRQQQAHRHLRRLVRKPRALPDRSDAGRDLGVGQRPRGRAPRAERHLGRHVRQQPGRPVQPTWRRNWTSSTWPICT